MRKPEELQQALTQAHYVIDSAQALTVALALHLEKPLLVEGPAGVGKTELAKALSRVLLLPLIRLQCYEGLGEEKALYEWNYSKQLLHIQADRKWDAASADTMLEDIFSEDYLMERPLLRSIRSEKQTVLLVDELDRVDEEFEAFLLELLSDFQVTIPELGTLQALHKPVVVLTSNATRALSEALRRRCVYLYMDFPEPQRERDIVMRKVPGIEQALVAQVVRLVQKLRQQDLKKPPSVSETLDWTHALKALNVDTLDTQTVSQTAGLLLKHQSDLKRFEQLGNLLAE